jgi:hypothetical protein
MGALDGVYAKLDRARVHAREMKQRLDAGLDPELHEFVREYDGSPSKYVYKIERLPAVDPKWSLYSVTFSRTCERPWITWLGNS